MQTTHRHLLLWSRKQTYAEYVASLAPVLWLRLRETSGTAVDNAGSGGAALDATWTAGAGALGQTGQLGVNEGYDFDSADSRIQANTVTGLNVPAFTAAILCKPDTAGEGGVGAFLFLDNGTDFEWRWNDNLSSINCERRSNDVGARAIGDTPGVSAGAWTWLFATYDDNGDRTPRLYFGNNGLLRESSSYSTFRAATGTINAIGTNYSVGNNPTQTRTFDGVIDEILFFDSVLSEAAMLLITQASGL